MIVRASRILASSALFLDGGALLVRRGRIAALLEDAASITRARTRGAGPVVDLGEGLLVPGLVDAHAHLELSCLAGELPADQGFVGWLRAIVRAKRARSERDFERSVAAGARRLLETGTTAVGDIASTRGALRAERAGLRGILYRELLDVADPERRAGALAFARRARPARGLGEGLAPHTPYTTSAELLDAAAALARRRRLPVTVHWEESEHERPWLERGRGALAALLEHSPRRSGLELLRRAGLLTARTSLVHGNHPAPGELAVIARAGAIVVHCPGTQLFFGRGRFPWRRYRRAGIELALGTDSLASNEDLDGYREMRLFRRAEPEARPERVWEMATTNAARALGLEDAVGSLAPGRWADLVLHRGAPRGRAQALEFLTAGGGAIRSVWLAGRERVRLPLP